MIPVVSVSVIVVAGFVWVACVVPRRVVGLGQGPGFRWWVGRN